jgi:hypothetical protein
MGVLVSLRAFDCALPLLSAPASRGGLRPVTLTQFELRVTASGHCLLVEVRILCLMFLLLFFDP